jgi:hypothetical protein
MRLEEIIKDVCLEEIQINTKNREWERDVKDEINMQADVFIYSFFFKEILFQIYQTNWNFFYIFVWCYECISMIKSL